MEEVEQGIRRITLTDNEGQPSNPPSAGFNTVEIMNRNVAPTAPLNFDPDSQVPGYRSHRLNLFNMLKSEYEEKLYLMRHEYICVDLPAYNRSIAEMSWRTTPTHIALYLGGEALLENTIIARVNGELWDLDRVLEASCTLEFLDINTYDGNRIFRRSCAFVLGQAIEFRFNCLLGRNSVAGDNFFYELGQEDHYGAKINITTEGIENLQRDSERIISEGQKFERLYMDKGDLLAMFKYNKYKLKQISAMIPNNGYASVYRCGSFIDLYPGPHMRDTKKIRAFQIETKSIIELKWHADMVSMRYICGISFPEKYQLDEYNRMKLRAQQRGLGGAPVGNFIMKAPGT